MRRATEIKILISDALSLIKVCVSALSGFITLETAPHTPILNGTHHSATLP